MKILRIIVLLALVTTTFKVYDREFRLTEIWRDKGSVIEVYSPQMERRGTIVKKERTWERYDKEMNRESTIKIGDKKK